MTAPGRIVAIGERALVQGFALGGAYIYPAETPQEVLAAWHALPPGVSIAILTRAAARAIEPRPPGSLPLTVVIPR